MDLRITVILLASIAAAIAIFYASIWIAILALRFRIAYVPDSPLTTVARRLLVVAPRPADAVAIGAGQAMRSLVHGGAVRVVLIGDPAMRATALAAWGELGLGEEAVVCHDPGGALLPAAPAACAAAGRALADEIARFAPDRVVTPLLEGADPARDAVHLATVCGLAASGVGTELFEGLLHNTYCAWNVTPRRWIARLEHLIPGRHPAAPPPEPIDPRPVYAQPMSPADIATRIRMLERCAGPLTGAGDPGDTPPLPPAHEPERLQCYEPRDYARRVHPWARVDAFSAATLAAVAEVVRVAPAC